MDYVCLLLFLFSRVLEVSHPNLAILFIHSSTQAAFLCKKLDYDLPSSQKISPCLAGQVLDVCQRPCHIFVLVWALAGRSENKTNPRFFKSKRLLTLLGGSNCNKCLWKELYQQNDEKIVPLGPVKHSHPPLHPFSQSTWCFWIPWEASRS